MNAKTDAAASDTTKPAAASDTKDDLKTLPLPDLQEKLQA